MSTSSTQALASHSDAIVDEDDWRVRCWTLQWIWVCDGRVAAEVAMAGGRDEYLLCLLP